MSVICSGLTPTALKLTGSLFILGPRSSPDPVSTRICRWPSCIKNALTDASTGDFTYAFARSFSASLGFESISRTSNPAVPSESAMTSIVPIFILWKPACSLSSLDSAVSCCASAGCADMRLRHKRLKHVKAARIGPIKRRVFMSAPLVRSGTQRPYESERSEHHDDCAKLPRSQEKIARPCDEIAGDHRWQTHGEVRDQEDHRQHTRALPWRS